jgi:hypothetical protein
MTTTVYLDESGDLGFDFANARTSRHFPVAALASVDTKAIGKAVKKVFGAFTKAQAGRHPGPAGGGCGGVELLPQVRIRRPVLLGPG